MSTAFDEDLLKIPDFLKRQKGQKMAEPTEPLKSIEEIYAEQEAAERAARIAIKDVPEEDVKPKKAAPRKSPREAMKEQIDGYLGELEEEVDNFVLGGYQGKFEIYKWLNLTKVKSPQAAAISEFYKPQLAELEELCKSNPDPDLLEGYSHLKKDELKRFTEFMKTLVEDSARWSKNVKPVKGQRKKRSRSIEQVVKHMKFKAEDPTFKVTSVDPSSILGASELWVLHTGYVKKIGVYRAIDRGGLQIHRSSVRNFDTSNSVEKRIGKNPDETIKKILEGGKVSLRKLTSSLKAKDEEPSGKINSNIVLLRVIK